MQNDVLATGIMSFVMHEVVYFGRSLPWIIIDRIPAFNKYKIQNVSLLQKKPPWLELTPCSKKSQPLQSNGIVPDLSFSVTLLSSFLRSGALRPDQRLWVFTNVR